MKLLLFLPLLVLLWFLGRTMRRSRSAGPRSSETGACGDASGGYASGVDSGWGGDGYGGSCGDGGDGGGDGGG